MNDEQLTARLVVLVEPSMLSALDVFWRKHNLDGRSDAVRHMIRLGLEQDDPGSAEDPNALPHFDKLPVVKVKPEQNVGLVPLVVQWLNAAIQREQRVRFSEDEIFRGAWKMPDSYELTKTDRATVRISMGPVGWHSFVDRSGPRGAATTYYQARPQ